MPVLGSHTSIAGGIHKAVERAAAVGCDCVQIFTASPSQWPKPAIPAAQAALQSGRFYTKNNNQWRAKALTDDDRERFQAALKKLKIKHPIAHDSYLINLASPDEALWQKSIDAFAEELLRCEQLGIPNLVTHPGAFTSSSEPEGLARVAVALDEVHRRTPDLKVCTLLETTAGQGSCLGWRFEHLAAIMSAVAEPKRLGVCVDTCHVFAAGYPLGTEREYAETMAELDAVVGLKRVKAFHLNDSKQGLGSRVDRHAHIGRGKLGLEPFRLLLNDARFRRTPMYLETAKEQENGVEMDIVNLQTLRGLIEA